MLFVFIWVKVINFVMNMCRMDFIFDERAIVFWRDIGEDKNDGIGNTLNFTIKLSYLASKTSSTLSPSKRVHHAAHY